MQQDLVSGQRLHRYYAIHVKEEYRKHGYARQICTGLLKEGMKKGAQNAYLQVVEEMTMPGHYTDHLDFSSFILTGSAYSQMKTEISHLRNKKELSVKRFHFLLLQIVLNFYRFNFSFSGNQLIH